VLAAIAWIAPRVLVLTALRDRPLQAAFAGIDGSVSSGAAVWGWLGGIEYRDILLRDRTGRALVAVPRLLVDRSLAQLVIDPRNLGTVRLVGAEALIDVRAGGSSLEDVLAPWLATFGRSPDADPPTCEIELVDGAVEFRDLVRGDAWRLTELCAAGAVSAVGPASAWTVAGRVRRAAPRAADTAADPAPDSAAADAARLDRATLAARATAALARDGGFSLSASEGDAAARSVTLSAHRLPLGVSALSATRFGGSWVADGLADVRLDLAAGAAGPRLVGSVAVENLAVCRAATLEELLTLARVEVPLDCGFADGRLLIHRLSIDSPIFHAQASGRIRLPTGGTWDWAEAMIEDDFAVAADVDLAAASRGLAGGMRVRPDVRVTDGHLQLAAAAHADGDDRVLEARLTARDLAAVQSMAAAGPDATDRLLRWSEPCTAFLRGRRAAGAGLRIEDARIVSPAIELAVAGDAVSSTITWTLDIGAAAGEFAEVLDFGGVTLAGTSRGRIEVSRADPTGPATTKLSASISDFACTIPGRPAWKDAEIALVGEAAGRLAGGAAIVEQAHAVLTAGGDRLEATLTGGAIVGIDGGAWLRAAPDTDAIAADCSLTGDLGRWQPRWAALWPAVAGSGAWSGTVKASASLAARGAAWQVTRAGAEVEKLSIRLADRRIDEPRVVATAAGLVHPASGAIEVSSGEVLTTTLSLRTGGMRWEPKPGAVWPAVLDRLRGKAQWRAHAGRLERWLVPAETAARWPVDGEVAGTLDVADTATGANLLVEATASQLSIGRSAPEAARAGGPPQRVWHEPRARVVLEVTRIDAADAVRIETLELESTTATLAARGDVQEWSGQRLLELGGTAAYDWEQVSRLLTPWTGGRIRFAGSGGRPFSVRGPLGRAAIGATAVPPVPAAEVVPLPEDWVAAARAGDRSARIARPVATSPAAARTMADVARGLTIDTTAAWTAADIDGFAIGPGVAPLRLVAGQLACGPLDVAAAGGRIRGTPWLRLAAPAELIVPQGRVVDRVTVSGGLCDRWVGWLSPLLGHATHARGVVSVDTTGARLPLADPFAGEAAAQVVFDEFEVTPAAGLQPLAGLLAKLQAVVDPRFAFGDKLVLLRVRPEPVTVRLTERRLWHEGLVMDAGQLVVRSRGSVAADGGLAMVVEVAFRGDIAGQTPVVAQLLRTPLAIPVAGTVHKPQFDARAIDVVLGRIVENTAQAVLQDGVARGLESLETIFGNPPAAPPAPAPPPLTFPGGR
jgi:hypothetical protein